MDVSEIKAMEPMADEMLKGAQLLEAVVSLSGLEHADANDQLMRILDGRAAPEPLTLDQLRGAMLEYLEQMNAEVEAGLVAEQQDTPVV